MTEQKSKLITALIKAKEQFDSIEKKGIGKVSGKTAGGSSYQYEYKYALLEDVIHATDPHLANNGLLVREEVEQTDKGLQVKLILAHESGEEISFNVPALIGETKRNDPQAMGAAFSYARRYGRCMLLGVVAEQDDDGSRARDDERKKKVVKDADDKSRTAGTKKTFINKYYDDIKAASDVDSLDILIVSVKEDYNAVLTTYTPEVRDMVIGETDKRISARRKELLLKA